MSPFRFVLAAALPLSLAACGVPDLVAHGVKSYERTQDANKSVDKPPPAAYQPAPAAQQPPPAAQTGADFVPAPAPPRESISSEPLR